MKTASVVEQIKDQISQIALKGFSKWDVYKDFLAMVAISLRNAASLSTEEGYQVREEEYQPIINKYDPDSQAVFPAILTNIVMALEQEPQDICGKLFESIELADSWKGQFFTPDDVGLMMSEIIIREGIKEIKSNQNGFVTVCEPAIGSGTLVIQFFNAIRTAGYNPQQVIHVTGTDIDITAVHMAYILLSLLHIPAIIIHGDDLAPKN